MSKARRKRHARVRIAREIAQASEMEAAYEVQALEETMRSWPKGFSISGTVTGRTSSREPNIQNLPRNSAPIPYAKLKELLNL